MKRSIESSVAVVMAVLMFGFAASLSAQESEPGSTLGLSEPAQAAPIHIPSAEGTLIIPSSSIPQTPAPGEPRSAHTNVEIFIPHGLTPEEAPPFPGYGYETPASLACVYGLVTAVAGCNPNTTTTNPTGGSKAIAIVDAYDDPQAYGDIAWFSVQFGLPLTLPQFQVVWAITNQTSCYSLGYVPTDYTGGWEVEESLDIEWSHAMAPDAKIYLVEACSNFNTDLQQAELVAKNLVQCGETEINPTTGVLGTCPSVTGKGEISNSWGEGEYVGENGNLCHVTNTILDDGCFTGTNVVYFASSGDSPGVIYPSVSPNVVAAGGLTNRRNPATFNFVQQTGWVDGGGGQSAIEPQPSYQSSGPNKAAVQAVCGTVSRCTPDLSFDADPITGVWVYDTFPYLGVTYQWFIVGGTSVAAPSLAGIINNAATRSGTFAASSHAELTTIYNNMKLSGDFTNITSAYCGPYQGFTAVAPWNFCSGVGADKGYTGK